MTNTHPDVDFYLSSHRAGGKDQRFKEFAKACQAAVEACLIHGGRMEIAVVIHSKEGARWFGGATGERLYSPRRTVFERIIVDAKTLGRGQ